MPHSKDPLFHTDDSIGLDPPSQKVDEYAQFLDQVLRPELKLAKSKVEEIELELSEYQQLGAVLQEKGTEQKKQQKQQSQEQHSSSKQTVDLGFQTVYSQAEIDDDCPHVYVNIGLGFHVQMTVQEATAFVEQRMDFLRTQVLPHRKKQLNQVEAHVQSSIHILEELEKVQEMMMAK